MNGAFVHMVALLDSNKNGVVHFAAAIAGANWLLHGLVRVEAVVRAWVALRGAPPDSPKPPTPLASAGRRPELEPRLGAACRKTANRRRISLGRC